jgi:hypothetical protein
VGIFDQLTSRFGFYYMLSAYFETSSLDEIVKSEIKFSQLREALDKNNFEPCIGLLTINECAQPILGGDSKTPLSLFKLIGDLKPRILIEPSMLYKAELEFLKNQEPVQPFVSSEDQEKVLSEIEILANGKISHEFYDLLVKRRDATTLIWSKHMGGYLAEIKKARRNSSLDIPRFRTFDQLKNYFQKDIVIFLMALPDLSLSSNQAEHIAANLEKFPAICGSLYFWWYAYFICLSDNRIPSNDKANDLRHLVEASYCQFFFTNDRQLYRQIPFLRPSLFPKQVKEFF